MPGLARAFPYVKGINNIKAGISYEQTFLTENDKLGIVDPTLNAPCITANTTPNQYTISDPFIPVQGFTDPSQCGAHGYEENVASNADAPNNPQFPLFNPDLLPYDLTRGGSLFATRQIFPLHTDVKELALYVQDSITMSNWTFSVGMRGDLYNGLTSAGQAEPRLGVAYNVKQSNTVLKVSYARTLETPFNENLVLSSIGCSSPVLDPLLACSSSSLTPVAPGFRNEFHAGLQQAFGKHVVFDGEYIWKYTHNGYDFSVLGNTPITFPIEWAQSKIPGFTAARERHQLPRNYGLCDHVQRRGAILPAAGRRSRRSPFRAERRTSASTTTRSSTKPPTSNTSHRRAGRGSASTGGTIAGLWRAQRHALALLSRTHARVRCS